MIDKIFSDYVIFILSEGQYFRLNYKFIISKIIKL
jgi:hypothetical protein